MKRIAYVIGLATTLFVSQVAAAPITYNLNGTVAQVGLTPPGVHVGDQIPISITVNDPGTGGPSYSYTAGSPGTPLISSALFNGTNYTSLIEYITIQVGSSISFLTTVPLTNYGFSLTLTGARSGALATGALPTSLNPGDFTGGTFTVINIAENNNEYTGTINGIGAPVPEPASLLLLGGACVGLLYHARLRRRDLHAN